MNQPNLQRRNLRVLLSLLLGLGVVLGAAWFGRVSLTGQTSPVQAPAVVVEAPKAGYWTCPMHPQIHSEHPGECPICHMRLVEVKPQQAARTRDIGDTPDEKRGDVVANDGQLRQMGVQKTVVEKMDLTVHIPIAGRFISPTTVAFQVYETDLRYVKPGLNFSGESGFKPDSPLAGTVTAVDSIVDPTSRTVRVVGSIRSGPSGIIPETTFRGDLAIVLKGALGIPENSVLHSGREDLVYMIHEGGHLMAQPVKLGLKTESYYEVIDGLEAGDTISSGPNFLIDSEAKIRGAAGGGGGHTHH